VYGIVRDAKGTLTVYSEEGLGTTVSIHVPVAGVRAEAMESGTVVPAEGSGETILVVEDEDAVRAVACRILRRHGYEVIEPSSATEALAIALERDIDLVLTDVVMPHMSGRELAEALREAKPELPVLFMSGYSQGVLGPGHLLAEGVQVLQKPFHERALLAGVHDALRGAWAPAEVAPGDTSAD
jgi:CheY-like chemotaxis protein